MLKQIAALLLFFSALIAPGCGYTNNSVPSTGVPSPAATGGTGPASAATFTQVSQQILQPLCVGCHGASGRAPDLSSYSGFATNTRYVVPGNPSSSLIYTITQSGQTPPSGPALTQDQLNTLSSWIQAGALND